MKSVRLALPVALVILGLSCSSPPGRPAAGAGVTARYVGAWKAFYPSRALAAGMNSEIFGFEDFSEDSIRDWMEFNRSVLMELEAGPDEVPLDERIDRRLLRTQARSELLRWEEEAPHRLSPVFYAESLSRALSRIRRSPVLMPGEKIRLVRSRFSDMRAVCSAARSQLEDGPPRETDRAVQILEKVVRDISSLPEDLCLPDHPGLKAAFAEEGEATAGELKSLAAFLREEVRPGASLSDSPVLGPERYARRLAIYTDSDMTPERLEELALEEINTVRDLMAGLATRYLARAHPHPAPSADFDELVGRALADMEENRPRTEAEYLARLRSYAADAERFVREREIATLPGNQTLSLELAPESSGPMARIGYVSPPPYFTPNPWTTWYLATIPDSHPAAEREDFWRSFNYHFKRFIVIHELFPGHYIQTKITRENPHIVRILFPYGPYSEGWATLCERVALDAGWAERDPLTRLAQLRKRLENANRAYTSVQAHCRGWDERKVRDFSVGTSLLAPQFCKSLWGRLMRSPFQMTTYFLGYRMFSEVYESERDRWGDRFRTRRFMDTILRAGPIPIDAFPEIFREYHD